MEKLSGTSGFDSRSIALRLMFFSVVALGLVQAVSTYVNDCGDYSPSGTSNLFLNASITANGGSTITDGACVRIVLSSGSDAITFYPGNHTITNGGSSAIYAIKLVFNGGLGGTFTSVPSENLTLAGFGVSVKGNGLGVSAGMKNVYFKNLLGSAISTDSVAKGLEFTGWACNVSGALLNSTSASDTVVNLTFSNGPDCTRAIYWASSAQFSNSSSQLHLLSSDYALAVSVNMIGGYATTVSNGTRTFSAPVGSINSTNATSDKYLDLRSTVGSLAFEQTSFANLTAKVLYCPSTSFCNPLYFRNYTSWPFYIQIPTEGFCNVNLGYSYDYTEIWITSGAVPYLVFSAENNEYTTAYLVNNADYQIHREVGGMTVINNVKAVCVSGYPGYFSGDLSNYTLPVVYAYSGYCAQQNQNDSMCTFSTQSNASIYWIMKMINLSSGVEVCNSSLIANGGYPLSLNCSSSSAAYVVLYSNHSGSLQPIAFGMHTVVAIGSLMWMIFYGGCAVALFFTTTKVPLYMSLSEMALAYLFYTANAIPAVLAAAVFGVMAVLGFVSAISLFKKGN